MISRSVIYVYPGIYLCLEKTKEFLMIKTILRMENQKAVS